MPQSEDQSENLPVTEWNQSLVEEEKQYGVSIPTPTLSSSAIEVGMQVKLPQI